MNEGLGDQSDPAKEATKDREEVFSLACHPFHSPPAIVPLWLQRSPPPTL